MEKMNFACTTLYYFIVYYIYISGQQSQKDRQNIQLDNTQ